MSFLYYLSLSYVATTLLVSGVGHVYGFSSFRDLLRSHNIVPAALATLLSVVVAAVEIVVGIALPAIWLTQQGEAFISTLFVVCAVAGGVFMLYIRRLLQQPEGIESCGCSPFSGPLTSASIIPAAGLLLMSACGLIAAALGVKPAFATAYAEVGITLALPIVWGSTLALLVILLPASMPQPLTTQRG